MEKGYAEQQLKGILSYTNEPNVSLPAETNLVVLEHVPAPGAWVPNCAH